MANLAGSTSIAPSSGLSLSSAGLLTLPLEIRRQIFGHVLRNACMQWMRHHVPFNSRMGAWYAIESHPILRIVNTNVRGALQVLHMVNMVEYGTIEFKGDEHDREQREMSMWFDLTRLDIMLNEDLTNLQAVFGDEAQEEMVHQGYDLQFYGYGIPDLGSFNDHTGFLQNVKRITLSPTVYHGLDYTKALKHLPSLEMVYLDPMLIRFHAREVRFSPSGFLAGMLLAKPAAHQRLRVAAQPFFPVTFTQHSTVSDAFVDRCAATRTVPISFAAPGVQNALIVRQMRFKNINGRGAFLDVVYAKRIFESTPGELPWVVGLKVLQDGTSKYLSIDQVNGLLHVDITDTSTFKLDLDTITPEQQVRLFREYQKIAPDPVTEWYDRSFLAAMVDILYMTPNMGDGTGGIPVELA